MDNENILKKREKYLKEQENGKYFKNWERFSDRFGKKTLFELFKNGKEFLESKENVFNDKFKVSFVSKVLNPIKEKHSIDFVKKFTYSSLMSIFSKFVYFLRDYYQKKQEKVLSVNLDGGKIVQEKTKNIIISNLSIPKNEQIRPEEKELFSMDDDGNILPPKTENDPQIETKNRPPKNRPPKNENQLSFDF